MAANSRRWRRRASTATTADPPGGRMERDADGEPTGILHETRQAAPGPVAADTVVPAPTAPSAWPPCGPAYRELHAAGIATIHEIVRLPEEADDHAALRAAGELGVRIRLFYRVHESPLSLDWLSGLGIRRGLGDDWLRILGVKVSIDGFCIFRNAAVHEPYRNEPDNPGLLRIDDDDPRRPRRARGQRQGLQVAIHAVGPRAVDLALDAFERAGPPAAGPYRLEHAYLDIDEARLVRARELGVVWSVQPAFLDAYRREWADAFEPDRIDRIMPLRRGADLGLRIQLNSDFPCAPFDPSTAIRLAVDPAAVTAAGPATRQGLTVAEAWRAYTTTPAEVAGTSRARAVSRSAGRRT